jgi:hypothetical protein
MRRFTVLGIVLVITVGISACQSAAEFSTLRGDPLGMNHPLSSIEADSRPAMRFDSSKPYRLEFGRGSGWHGLDTVVLEQDGTVVMHRLKAEKKDEVIHQYWETGTFQLDTNATQRIAEIISNLNLVDMHRAYHADVHDGTQWVFWIVQGEEEKSIYFNNHFPEVIQDFAVALDSELMSAGSENITWTRVPASKERQHENAIWNSIKR